MALVLRLPAGRCLEALARIERKGLALRGLKSANGTSHIVLDAGEPNQAFATALQRSLGDVARLDACSSSDDEILAGIFSPRELLTFSDPCGGSERARKLEQSSEQKEGSADPMEDPTTYRKVLANLNSHHVKYETWSHVAVRTSEESAQVRGATLASGAKAMLLYVKPANEFILAVISAAAKMDSKLIKKVGGFKSTRFASEEEVRDITGCIPGAVPPFGSIWNLQTYMDDSLQANLR